MLRPVASWLTSPILTGLSAVAAATTSLITGYIFVAAHAPAALLSVATVAATDPSGASDTPVSKQTTGIPAFKAAVRESSTEFVSHAAKPIPSGAFWIASFNICI